jgi:hypothetical protein
MVDVIVDVKLFVAVHVAVEVGVFVGVGFAMIITAPVIGVPLTTAACPVVPSTP